MHKSILACWTERFLNLKNWLKEKADNVGPYKFNAFKIIFGRIHLSLDAEPNSYIDPARDNIRN